MSLFFGGRTETRDDGPEWGGIGWGRPGERITSVPSAMRLIPFYSAVTGIADDVAVTPWNAFEPDVGQVDKPALLTDPGFGLAFIPWMQQGCMSALVRGFAFGLVIAHDAQHRPWKVLWVDPDRVEIDDSNLVRPLFRVDGKLVEPGHYIYVPGPTLPGSIVGLSPVALFRLQLEKGLNAQRYASDFYERGIMPPGHLRNKARTVPPDKSAQAKEWFKEPVSGRDILVTGTDWEWNPLQLPKDDATFLETIKASATEIAAIFRVLAEDIGGETGSSMTYQTTELAELKRNRRALLPWVRRFEEALGDALSLWGTRPTYVRANLDALARADIITRARAHSINLHSGIETLEEGRAIEDKRPLTDQQIDQWQEWYSTASTPDAGDNTSSGGQSR